MLFDQYYMSNNCIILNEISYLYTDHNPDVVYGNVYIYIWYLYTTIYSIKLCIIYEHQQPVTVKLPLKLPS